MRNNNFYSRIGMIEFWVPDEELKKLKDGEDHHFALGWDTKQEEYFLCIDGKRPRMSTTPGRDACHSSVRRSSVWAKVTYLSALDGLVSFGEEEAKE